MSDDLNQTIRELKGLNAGPLNQFKLGINKPDGKELGWFSPITINSISDERIIEKLTEWRSIHKKCFFTQFNPTPTRTKKWLQESILPDDTKILFIIYDSDGTPIGNFGMRDICGKSAELDNLIIGDSKSHGPFILIAVKTFIKWTFLKFNFDYLTASVFKHNDLTLLIDKKLGFKIIKEIPVKKIENNNEIQYVPIENVDPPDAYIIEMRIEPSKNL